MANKKAPHTGRAFGFSEQHITKTLNVVLLFYTRKIIRLFFKIYFKKNQKMFYPTQIGCVLPPQLCIIKQQKTEIMLQFSQIKNP
jgi:hypothetical protein